MAIVWDDIHYNVHETRTHDCDINVLLSGREAGKSTALVKYLLDEYEKRGSGFVWLLREVGQLNKEFYNSFLNDFEDRNFVIYRNRVHALDPKTKERLPDPIGFFFGLSTANKRIKQTKLKNIDNVVYDEFLIDHTLPNEKYLENEAEVLFKVYDTLQRRSTNYKTKLWMLGNPYSLINPYFTWFKVEAKEVEARKNKFYKPYGKRLLVYYFDVHPELLEKKEATTYGFFSKLNKNYYEHTFKSRAKYGRMFAVVPFNKYLDKKYLFKVKIDNTLLEFWDIKVGIYVAEREYKKGNAIALDFDSFQGNTVLHNPMDPMNEIIKKVKYMVSRRMDVVLESSNIENAVKLFAKQS